RVFLRHSTYDCRWRHGLAVRLSRICSARRYHGFAPFIIAAQLAGSSPETHDATLRRRPSNPGLEATIPPPDTKEAKAPMALAKSLRAFRGSPRFSERAIVRPSYGMVRATGTSVAATKSFVATEPRTTG